MSVDALLQLRDDIGRILSSKASQLQGQLLRARRRSQQLKERPTKLAERPEGSDQISRQVWQHLGRKRSDACLVARTAEGRREA
jgi:hypothetical protein